MAMDTDPFVPAFGLAPGKREDSSVSPVERLMGQFERHENLELDFLKGYGKIVEDISNPMVRFLLRLIISDEEKHHAVVRAMTSTIRGELNWKQSDDAIPSLGEISRDTKQQLLELTREFIKEEKNTIKEYEGIIGNAKSYRQGTFALLMQTIIHDSKKHIMILEFLEKKLEDA